jgi:hypothetical protein
MTVIGYRVSTTDQALSIQEAALKAAGCPSEPRSGRGPRGTPHGAEALRDRGGEMENRTTANRTTARHRTLRPAATAKTARVTGASASFCWFVEHFPYSARELIERERLLKQPHSRIKATVVDDGVARIARREQDLQAGPRDRRLISKHPSGPARQDHVGEQKVYAVIRPQNR